MGLVLVTGATGTVGSAIVRRLAADGRHVRALVRSPAEAAAALPAGVDLAEGDVTGRGSVAAALDGCHVVYHAAGLPEQWQRDVEAFARVNVDGTRNLVEASLTANVESFVYTSTIDVFAWSPGQPFDESTIDQDPKGTYYERSKQLADRVVVEGMVRGLAARFAHPSAVYGPVGSVRPGLNRLLLDLARGKVPVLLPGGLPVVHADDVATGHLALEQARVGERLILSERYYSLLDVAQAVLDGVPTAKIPRVMPGWVATAVAATGEEIARITHRPPLIARGELHFLRSHAMPDASRARAVIDWRPRVFADGLVETIPALLATVFE